MQSIRSLKLVWLAVPLVALAAVVFFATYSSGYEAGKDAALRDNRSDAALAAQQNVEG